MAKGQTLQDPFLNILRKEKVPVSIYHVNASNCKGRWIHLINLWCYSKTVLIRWFINMRYRRSSHRATFAFLCRTTKPETTTSKFIVALPRQEVAFV